MHILTHLTHFGHFGHGNLNLSIGIRNTSIKYSHLAPSVSLFVFFFSIIFYPLSWPSFHSFSSLRFSSFLLLFFPSFFLFFLPLALLSVLLISAALKLVFNNDDSTIVLVLVTNRGKLETTKFLLSFS